MPIEFLCPSCQQQLRVPDAAAGKNARCPGCSTIAKVPETSQPPAANPLSPPAQPGFNFGPPEPKPSAPSGGSFGAPPSNSFGAPPPGNPFGDSAAQPWGGAKGPVNPYASPAGGFNELPPLNGPIGHQIVEIGPIMNHAFKVWQDNLGLLVGVTVVAAIIAFMINIVAGGALGVALAGGEPVVFAAAGLVLQLAAFLVTTFLGIGQAIIFLKLARGQRAEFSDLFSGGPRFFPIVGLLLLIYGPQLLLQTLSSAIGGPRGGNMEILLVINLIIIAWALAFIVLGLIYWPCYYLVLEGRAPVFQSFALAAQITQGNRLHSFLMFLLIIGISILGFLACLVGLLFAVPLTQVILAVAYLMMSAQLSTNPSYQRTV